MALRVCELLRVTAPRICHARYDEIELMFDDESDTRRARGAQRNAEHVWFLSYIHACRYGVLPYFRRYAMP